MITTVSIYNTKLIATKVGNYFNGSHLCESANVSFSNWHDSQHTKNLIPQFEELFTEPPFKFVTEGEPAEVVGTYCHPWFLCSLLMWSDIKFSSKVYDLVKRYKVRDS
jgi:hypothetical protein